MVNPWFQEIKSLGIPAIDHLFNRLDGIYVGKWRASFKTPDAVMNWRNEWATGLAERGIMPGRKSERNDYYIVIRALRNCADMYSWPPSLTEFIKACETPSRDEPLHKIEPSLVGLPPPKRVMPDNVKAVFAAVKNRAVLRNLN